MNVSKNSILGITSGCIQTAIYSPLDKAIYFSVLTKTSLFTKSNWKNPYKGVGNSLIVKCLSNGLYFAMIDYYNDIMPNRVLSGIATGCNIALLVSPFHVVKYRSWSANISQEQQMRLMIREGGIRHFFHGLPHLMARDAVFSIAYILCNDYCKKYSAGQYFVGTFAGSCVATMVSSPFNYVKTLRYSNADMSTRHILEYICGELLEKKSIWDKSKHICQQLAIGWGVLRIGLGITTGQIIYDGLKELLRSKHS